MPLKCFGEILSNKKKRTSKKNELKNCISEESLLAQTSANFPNFSFSRTDGKVTDTDSDIDIEMDYGHGHGHEHRHRQRHRKGHIHRYRQGHGYGHGQYLIMTTVLSNFVIIFDSRPIIKKLYFFWQSACCWKFLVEVGIS